MSRRSFTKALGTLIVEMVYAGDQPVIDYCLRSAEEQKRLFDKGLSKCDGYIKKSPHQSGLAADLYLVEIINNKPVIQFTWNLAKSTKWHDRWVELGGSPVIDWDLPHFQFPE